MKKFLALVMAFAMIMNLSALAMAAPANGVITEGDPSKGGVAIVGPFDYDADANYMRDSGLVYGDTVYYLLLDRAGSAISQYDAVSNMRLKTSYEMGKELVESVTITKKYINLNAANHSELAKSVAASGYYYFVALKTAEIQTTTDADVIGTFTFNRKAVDLLDSGKTKGDDPTGIEDKIDDVDLDFGFNIFYGEYDYIADPDNYLLVSDSIELKWDRPYVLKFDSDDVIDLTFGADGANEGVFSVDVSGQNKLYLKYDTNADDDIVAANPGVKMHFLNFNGVKFNRTGEFAYEMDNGAAAYKVVDGRLEEIPGCEYDSSDDAFYFKTRVLENYVFASDELVNPADDTPAVEAPTVESVVANPSTGVSAPDNGVSP